MTEDERKEILIRAKDFFRNTIAPQHVLNTKKCKSLSKFNVNPFLVAYLANFLTGNGDSRSIAKALVYPRVLGTSITTSFGSHIQRFCTTVFPESFGSAISGIDIEFIDCTDGRRKYCQVKAGPNTINHDDVDTIINKFSSVNGIARQNNLQIGLNDLIVGVLYGTSKELSTHYQRINAKYPVYAGSDFWHRLTGSAIFYNELIAAIGEVAVEANGVKLLEEVVEALAKEIDVTK